MSHRDYNVYSPVCTISLSSVYLAQLLYTRRDASTRQSHNRIDRYHPRNRTTGDDSMAINFY